MIGKNILNRKGIRKMEKYEIGDIIKTKAGDKCIIVDIEKNKAMVFNMSKMHPDKIKLNEIEEKMDEPNCTTVVINGKKVKDTNENNTEKEDEIEIDGTDKLIELLRMFGKAASELGRVLEEITEEEDIDEE